jgi:hypothetical protein
MTDDLKTPEQMAEDIREGVSKVASELWGDDEQAEKFAEAIHGTWLAGYQAAKPQWISVKERLPEEGVGWTMVYGCILSRWSVQPGFYDSDSNEWVSRFINGYEDEEGYARLESVTHWHPLPEAPKEEK